MSEDPKNNKPDDDFEWGKIGKNLGFALLGIIFLLYVTTFSFNSDREVDLKYYSVLVSYAEKGIIKSLDIYAAVDGKPAIYKGEFHEEQQVTDPQTNRSRVYKYFRVNGPTDTSKESARLNEYVTNIRMLEHEGDPFNFLVGFLPWIFILAVFFLFTRRMQGGIGGSKGGGGIFSIGKSKARMLAADDIKVNFSDVAGADEAKHELEEVIEFLKTPEKFTRLGGKIPKGVLLTGPPGTGKTLLARAVAGEAGVPFFSISGSDFVEMFVGVGASRVRDLFEQARKHSPCIIFVDEIDAVGRQRGVGLGGGNDEREQTLNALLVEMDGFDERTNIILVAATNRPDVLDEALLRPGRFDRRVVVERPDIKGREGILDVHTRNVPLATDVDIKQLALGTPGFSGADIANLVNEAALLAARFDKDAVDMEDFENAKDKVILGLERKTLVMKEDEKKATAYHEAGHTIVGKMIKGQDPVYKVTIIPRGFALGVTWSLPQDDVVTQSKEFLEGKLAQLLGGRVAEKIVFNHTSSGAGNDIEKATEIARRMVCEFGMSDKIGPISVKESGQESFTKTHSEKTAQDIDSEIKRIVTEAEQLAHDILTKNRDVLDKMSEELFKRETLVSEEIDKIIEGKELPEFIKKVNRSDKDRMEELEKIRDKYKTNDSDSEENEAGFAPAT
jgi:cell division protease FtsH